MKRVYDTANFYHFVHTMVRRNQICFKLSTYAAGFAHGSYKAGFEPQEITYRGVSGFGTLGGQENFH